MRRVSREWFNEIDKIIVKKLNLNRWSIESLGITNTKSALKFVKIYARFLDYWNLGNIVQSANVTENNLRIHSPKSWSFTQKLNEIECLSNSLSNNLKIRLVQTFRTVSDECLDTHRGITHHFVGLDLPNPIMEKLKELDVLLIKEFINSNKTSRFLMKMRHYLSQFGAEEKLPLRKTLVWRYAISQLIEHLKSSELTHATQIAERCVQGPIDCSKSIMPWFKGIALTEEDKFHLENLNRAFLRRARQIIFKPSINDDLTSFCLEFTGKLSQIRLLFK